MLAVTPKGTKGVTARPLGQHMELTPEWYAWLKSKLKPWNPRGKTQRWLAEAVDCTPSAINQITKGRFGGSKLVGRINEVLGGAPAVQIIVDNDEQRSRLLAIWPRLPETVRAALLAVANSYDEKDKATDK